MAIWYDTRSRPEMFRMRLSSIVELNRKESVQMAFRDSSKPITTCVANDCNDCGVKTVVHCHFRPKELARFLLIVFPCFLIGGVGVFTH
jgi:hypothetical protein